MKTGTTHSRLPVILFLLLMGIFIGSTLAAAVEVGEPAPDFTLQSTTGKEISLSQFRDKKNVLVQFYTLDFNPTWTANLKARMADQSAFEKLNIQLIGISASTSFSQKVFSNSMKLRYPLLSDHPGLDVIRRYGVMKRIGEADRPVAQGSYFLIDKKGIIRNKWLNPPGEVFPNDILLKGAHENLE